MGKRDNVGAPSDVLSPPIFDRVFVFTIGKGQSIPLGCMDPKIPMDNELEWYKYTFAVGDACYENQTSNCTILSSPMPMPADSIPGSCEEKCKGGYDEYCIKEWLCEFDDGRYSAKVRNLTRRINQSGLKDTLNVDFGSLLPLEFFTDSCERGAMLIAGNRFVNHGPTCRAGIELKHAQFNTLWFHLPEILSGAVSERSGDITFTFEGELNSPVLIFGECQTPGENCEHYSERVARLQISARNILIFEGEASHCIQLGLCPD